MQVILIAENHISVMIKDKGVRTVTSTTYQIIFFLIAKLSPQY